MPERPISALNAVSLFHAAPRTSAAGVLHHRIERYFEISLYLLVTAGFTTIGSTGKLDILSVGFVFVALIARGYLLIVDRQVQIPESWSTIFTLSYVAFYALDYFLLSGSFVTATVHLVLAVMVVKIFSVHRDRDYLYLAVLAFLEVLAASVLTVDTIFLIAFSIFLLLGVSTLVTMEMRRSSAAALERARDSALAAQRLPAALSATAGLLVAAILAAAVVIFFVLPRLSGGYLGAFATQNEIASGFANEVNLGKIGQIQQLSTVVMHVQIYGDTKGSHELKWRGVSLGIFDGSHWSNPAQEPPEIVSPSLGGFDLSAIYRRRGAKFGETPPVRTPQSLVHYRVLMEPIGTNIFFLVPRPETLAGGFREVTMDVGGALYNSDGDRMINTYEAISTLAQPPPEQLQAAKGEVPYWVQLRYLQLPQRLDRRIPELAQQVTASSPTAYDKAVAIETHLKAQYGYTLQLPATPPSDPVSNFLFDRKQGHCEYFASAMTVMLRTLGIPARLITGFRGGEFNDITSNYIIRARDAHSWVEAYFPGQGWISFDPTPAGARSTPTVLSRWALYLDAWGETWREWVVNYDFMHQRTLSITTAMRSRRAADRARLWVLRHYRALVRTAQRVQERGQRAPLRWTAVIVGGLSALLLLVNARRLWDALRRLRLARTPERAPQAAASIWYTRLTRSLARRGWRKLPTQTPQEFVSSIGDPCLRQSVAQFTQHYQRARFGDSAADAARLRQLFAEITASR